MTDYVNVKGLYLDPETIRKLRQMAVQEQTSMIKLVRKFIREGLGEANNSPPSENPPSKGPVSRFNIDN